MADASGLMFEKCFVGGGRLGGQVTEHVGIHAAVSAHSSGALEPTLLAGQARATASQASHGIPGTAAPARAVRRARSVFGKVMALAGSERGRITRASCPETGPGMNRGAFAMAAPSGAVATGDYRARP